MKCKCGSEAIVDLVRCRVEGKKWFPLGRHKYRCRACAGYEPLKQGGDIISDGKTTIRKD